MERIGSFTNDCEWFDTEGKYRRGVLLCVARIGDRWIALALTAPGDGGRALEVDVLDSEFGVCFHDDAIITERAKRWMVAHPGMAIDWGQGVSPRGLLEGARHTSPA